MNDQKELWSLQLTKYLIVHKGYTQVRFVNAADSSQKEMDIWLANPNATFPAIHITTNKQSFNLARQALIREQYNGLLSVIKKQGRLLDVCLDPEGTTVAEDDIVHLALYPNASVPDNILSSLENINTVVFNVDDPQEETERLKKDIEDYVLKNNMPDQRRKRHYLESFSKTTIVAGSICIAICAAVNILSYITKYSTVGMSIVFGAYYKAFVLIFHDWWRLLTGGFVHINIWHLWCNMLALHNISKVVENRIGFWKTMIILLVSTVVGNLAVFIGDDNTVTVGLSGGIYGLLAALTVIYWQEGYFKIPALRRAFYTTAYINLIMNFMPNVSVLAHVGGFVAGLFLSFALMKIENTTLKNNFIAVGIALAAFLCYYTTKCLFINAQYFGTDLEVSNILKHFGLYEFGQNVYDMCYRYYTKGV